MLAHCVWCAQNDVDPDLYAAIINNQWAEVEVKHFQNSAGVVTLRYERSTPTDEQVRSVN